MKHKRGFTLLELLIVVIIIAILVVIAIPLYTRALERGRSTEAYTQLGGIRNAEIRYYQQWDSFTASFTALDVDNPNITAAMGKSYFSSAQGENGGYTLVIGGGGATFTATAARNNLDLNRIIYPTGYNMTIVFNGEIAGGP